jgi:hypothetical protein
MFEADENAEIGLLGRFNEKLNLSAVLDVESKCQSLG